MTNAVEKTQSLPIGVAFELFSNGRKMPYTNFDYQVTVHRTPVNNYQSARILVNVSKLNVLTETDLLELYNDVHHLNASLEFVNFDDVLKMVENYFAR